MTACKLPPRPRTQSSANNASAVLSAPPETPAARRGRSPNGPNSRIAAANAAGKSSGSCKAAAVSRNGRGG